MKIAFVLSTCAKLGPFIVAKDIIDNIADKVELIDIYYIKESDEKLSFKANCYHVTLFSKTDFSDYDVVHAHGFLGDVYLSLNQKSVRGKTITTLHQKIAPDYGMQYNRVVGYLLQSFWLIRVAKFTTVVALTKEMANYYQEILHRKIHFVYNGISPVCSDITVPEHLEIQTLKEKYAILGISANLIYRKGIDRVLEALAHPEASNLALVILGDGPMKNELLDLSDKLGIPDRCLFLGYKKNAINYFKYFDIYVMSSRSEGFGLCVLEAISQKIPVVCNDLSVYRELFDEHDVTRFDINNTSSMINAIKFALTNKEILSKNAHNAYERKFTVKKMATKYLELYQGKPMY